MSATLGSDEDEYARDWSGPTWDSPSEQSRLLQGPNWDLLLVHGYLGMQRDSGLTRQEFVDQIMARWPSEVNPPEHRQVLLLYHDSAGVLASPSDIRFTITDYGKLRNFGPRAGVLKALREKLAVPDAVVDELCGRLGVSPDERSIIMSGLRVPIVFADLQHQVYRSLLAIDIDLQNWRDSGFDAACLREIVEHYQVRPAPTRLDDVRAGVYISASAERDSAPVPIVETVESMLRASEDQTQASKLWEKVKRLLPPALSADEKDVGFADPKYVAALGILKSLGDEAGMRELQTVFERASSTNPFREWFLELMGTLDELGPLLRVRSGMQPVAPSSVE